MTRRNFLYSIEISIYKIIMEVHYEVFGKSNKVFY